MSIHQRPLFVRQAERCVSLKRRCYVVCTYGACFQRFKVSPLRCFKRRYYVMYACGALIRVIESPITNQISSCLTVSSKLQGLLILNSKFKIREARPLNRALSAYQLSFPSTV